MPSLSEPADDSKKRNAGDALARPAGDGLVRPVDEAVTHLPGLPADWFERFEHGVAEFNDEKFYDCHETLERCWQEQGLLAEPMADPHREWVQGLIQVAVGFHHLQRDNVKGALKLLNRGLARIKKFPLISYPLQTGPFEAIVKSTIDELEALGEPPSAKITLRFPKVEHK